MGPQGGFDFSFSSHLLPLHLFLLKGTGRHLEPVAAGKMKTSSSCLVHYGNPLHSASAWCAGSQHVCERESSSRRRLFKRFACSVESKGVDWICKSRRKIFFCVWLTHFTVLKAAVKFRFGNLVTTRVNPSTASPMSSHAVGRSFYIRNQD